MNKESYSNIVASIKSLDPTAQVVVVANDIKQINWVDNNPNNITEEQILAKRTELEAEYDALDYARTRQTAYPATKDFMEAYTEKEIGGDTTKWDAYVINYNKTRSDNPK